jgi:glycosidase
MIRKMAAVRKAHPAFGNASLSWADAGSQAVAAYWRFCDSETLLILNNLSGSPQPVVVSMPEGLSPHPLDLLAGTAPAVVETGKLSLTLAPYQFIWFEL